MTPDRAFDLTEELLAMRSRSARDSIVDWVGADSRRVKQLMDCFLKGDCLIAQRAAWVVSMYGERHPLLVRPYLRQMVRRMQQPDMHDSVRRCVTRILQWADIPDKLLGLVANACFEQLSSVTAPVAVKCNAMTVLARIAEKEPDLGRELQLVIAQQIPFGTAGFKARAKEILNTLPPADGTLPID